MADGAKIPETGFAGLASLVSDVEGVIRNAERRATEQGRPQPTVAASPGRADAPASGAPARAATAQQEPTRTTTIRWGRLAAVAGIIGFVALIAQGSEDSVQPTTPLAAPPETQYSAPDPTASAIVPGLTPAGDILDERRPVPGGRDRVLEIPEIRYCLAEEIRMAAAEAAVNRYTADVDRFNTDVEDYNARCGQYRYRGDAVEQARADVERHRSELETEGRARFGTSEALPSGPGHSAVAHAALSPESPAGTLPSNGTDDLEAATAPTAARHD